MSHYDRQMCTLLSRRAGDWLLTHAWPRFTAFFGIVLGLVVAYHCSIQLLNLGLENRAGRFALNAVGGYLVFLTYLGIWLFCIPVQPAKSLVIDGDQSVKTEIPGTSQFDDSMNDAIDNAIRESGRQANGVLGFIVVAGVLGLLFIGCHFVFHAPWYLGKLMVDGGKVHHRSTPAESPLACIVLPIRQTWPAALLLVLHYATMGAVLDFAAQAG